MDDVRKCIIEYGKIADWRPNDLANSEDDEMRSWFMKAEFQDTDQASETVTS
jgi:hypothetical protein